jgi:hypothetical protein
MPSDTDRLVAFPLCGSFPCKVCLNDCLKFGGQSKCVPIKHTLCSLNGGEELRLEERTPSQARTMALGLRIRRPPRALRPASTFWAHTNHERYAGQPFFLVRREDYVFWCCSAFARKADDARAGEGLAWRFARSARRRLRTAKAHRLSPRVVSTSTVCRLNRPGASCAGAPRSEDRHESDQGWRSS